VSGFRLDYLSPVVYLIDIVIAFYFLLNLSLIIRFIKGHNRYLIPIAIFITLNTLFSLNPLATFYLWSRWIFYIFWLVSLKVTSATVDQIIKPLSISVIMIVILSILQIAAQSSVGGVFMYLGERSFNQSTPQVAKSILDGVIFLRPYATFSHPNSLAGYLLLSLYLLSLVKNTFFTRLICLIGIAITLSKTVIITTLIYLAGLLKKKVVMLILTIPILVQISPLFIDSITSLKDRYLLLSPIANSLRQYPLFGVGLGGSFSYLVTYLPVNKITPTNIQPVHNIILLWVSETGLAGLVFMIYIIRKLTSQKSSPALREILLIIFLTGGFDHYWLTLPQNKLILLLTIFIVYNKNKWTLKTHS